jgi:hypothetical protein
MTNTDSKVNSLNSVFNEFLKFNNRNNSSNLKDRIKNHFEHLG